MRALLPIGFGLSLGVFFLTDDILSFKWFAEIAFYAAAWQAAMFVAELK
jgi:hypothetical protein